MDSSVPGSGAPGGGRELRKAGRGLGELAAGRQATEGFRSKAPQMEGASSLSEGTGGLEASKGRGRVPRPPADPRPQGRRLPASSLSSGMSVVTQPPACASLVRSQGTSHI